MLIPRFSIRFMLVATTGAGFFFVVLAAAVRGHALAIGFSAAVGSIVALFLLYVVLFTLSVTLSRGRSKIHPDKKRQSPFATESLPPQVLPPSGDATN